MDKILYEEQIKYLNTFKKKTGNLIGEMESLAKEKESPF
jgi:hypothetical protein